MKIFFYGLWNDLKRNKFFNILMFAEVLILLAVFTLLLGFSDMDAKTLGYYNSKNSDLALVSKNSSKIEMADYIGQDGFKNIGLSCSGSIAVGDLYNYRAIIIDYVNPALVSFMDVPHRGDWFSGDESGEFKEAIVSLDYKKQYKIGESYTIEDAYENPSRPTMKIKVIGYLGTDNNSLQASYGGGYEYLYSTDYDMMVCDSSRIDIKEVSRFISNEKPAQFYDDNKAFEAISLKQSYDTYRDSTKELRYFTNYIISIVVALIVVCIIVNSVFKVEKDIKRNMLKYVVGNSNKNIVLGEIVKSVGLFVIPLILVIIATPIVGAIMKANSSRNIITWENLFISAGIILAIYLFSTLATLLRTILAKPLKELKKD